ncbi:hypothetical protein E2562_009914 [Oryza meyeriana var. granulata]|uniref:Uncharacterized protein n=1 Tax=Oryza meyeriana var. granulata TaxID=110450 RepID=A0A6G1BUD9_9ORYZ|nr:hypothetical protein E2562_009914 [Oryza meyeriana var. granulata]
MARIEARLGHLLRGGNSTSAGGLGDVVAAVPAAPVMHAERRLHQLMSADHNQEERAASPTSAVSVQIWAEHGYHSVLEQAMQEMEAVCEEFFRLTVEDEGIGDRAAAAAVRGHGALSAGLLRRPAGQRPSSRLRQTPRPAR